MRITHTALTAATLCVAALTSAAPVPVRVHSQSKSDHADVGNKGVLLRRAPFFKIPAMTGNESLTLGGAIGGVFGLTLYEIAAALGTKSNENSFKANVANYIDKKQKAEQAERTLKAAQYEQARRAGEEAAAAAREWAAAAQKAMHALKHPKQGEEQTKKKEEETITQGGGTKLQRREIKDDLVKGTTSFVKSLSNKDASSTPLVSPKGPPRYDTEPSMINGAGTSETSELLLKSPSKKKAEEKKALKKGNFDRNNAIWAAIVGGWVSVMGVHALINASLSYDASTRLDLTKVRARTRRSTDDDLPQLRRRREVDSPPVVFVPNA